MQVVPIRINYAKMSPVHDVTSIPEEHQAPKACGECTVFCWSRLVNYYEILESE